MAINTTQQKRASAAPISLAQAVAEYNQQLALTAKRANTGTDNPGPDQSTHPTASAPDNTQPATEGERSKENEADVKANIPATINSAPEAPTKVDESENVDYHGAQVLENEQGVPPVKTTQNDPGTASKLDVSTEKTAAERKRIADLVKSQGRAKTASDLARQSMGELDALLNPAGAATKRAAAAAGAAAAAADLGQRNELVMQMVKGAAEEADRLGYMLGQEYAQYFHECKRASAIEGAIKRAQEEGASDEEIAAAMEGAGGEGEEEGGGEGEGEGEGAGEGEGMPAGPDEMPPEDIAALMEMGGAEGAGGAPMGGEVVPEDGAMALSDALDGLNLTPEQLMELEAAIQAEQGAAPETQAAELGKVACAINAVRYIRDAERVGRLQKRASANRTLLTAQITAEITKKASYMRSVFMRRQARGAAGRR